jgi:hypothetical protein
MAKINQPVFRRLAIVLVALSTLAIWLVANPKNYQPEPAKTEVDQSINSEFLAVTILEKLTVKPKYTEQKYVRTDFYSNWSTVNGCDMRNIILKRDLVDTVLDGCLVMSRTLHDPYTGTIIHFVRGQGTSSAVQIDHVVALSNAWATGAQQLDKAGRRALSQDPLNLLAVDGPANQQKSDQDASEWLPPNVAFQCQYVARQISVKFKYVLWVTSTEKSAMGKVLDSCPNEPTVGLEETPRNGGI